MAKSLGQDGGEEKELAAHPAIMPMMMSTVIRRQHMSFRLLFWCLCSSPAFMNGIDDSMKTESIAAQHAAARVLSAIL